MLYLPDTNIVIYAMAGMKPYETRMKRWTVENTLVFSSIVVAEFLSGAREKEEIVFRRLLDAVKVLPVDRGVAEESAKYKQQYSGKIKRIWLSDCLVAATCKVFGATLVTANTQDYPMKDIPIIKE